MKLGLVIIGVSLGVSMFLSDIQAQEVTSIVDTAQKNGVKRCIPQLEKVSNFIIDGKKHGTHATWSQISPDGKMYSSLTSKGYSDGNSHVSVIGAVNSEGKCDSYYLENYALAKSCMMARETNYKDLEYVGTLAHKTIVLKNAGGANYYLTPQGAANNICLVSKSETIYG